MKALLLIAHGSRRQASNIEVAKVAHALNAAPDKQFAITECAFLEIAEPSIPQGIDRCVSQGATHIRVVPYFLSAGRHVTEDVPTIISLAAQQHPSLTVSIAPHVGASKLMLTIIKDAAVSDV